MSNWVLLCGPKQQSVSEISQLIMKVLTFLWQEIQFLGQTFSGKWVGNIYIASRNNLLALFIVAFIVRL